MKRTDAPDGIGFVLWIILVVMFEVVVVVLLNADDAWWMGVGIEISILWFLMDDDDNDNDDENSKNKLATDAKERAEKIAENAGSDLGNLKKATMGVTQITEPNSTEEFSYGGTFNTSSKEKEASITIKLEYEVD